MFIIPYVEQWPLFLSLVKTETFAYELCAAAVLSEWRHKKKQWFYPIKNFWSLNETHDQITAKNSDWNKYSTDDFD